MTVTDTARSVPALMGRAWLVATFAAGIAFIGNVVAVLDRSDIYGKETSLLFDAVIAQDLVTGLVVFPVVIIAARRAMTGSPLANLVGSGAIAFLVYNYAIYCFSISFGPLFLLWTGVLGLSTYALIAVLRGTAHLDIAGIIRPTRLATAVLLGVSVTFAYLWLAEIVPDLLHGRPSSSAVDWDIPTNPVHVLDLAFFLPAAFVTGLRLHAGRRSGLVVAPGMLTFFALTCLPIIVTPFVAAAQSHDADYAAVGPVFAIAILALAALRSMSVTKPAIE